MSTEVLGTSLGISNELLDVEVIRTADGWHRRLRLGAFGWWQPEGCSRLSDPVLETKDTLPDTDAACPVCWPVWPSRVQRLGKAP